MRSLAGGDRGSALDFAMGACAAVAASSGGSDARLTGGGVGTVAGFAPETGFQIWT